MRRIAGIITLSALLLVSCGTSGSGEIVSDVRDLESFDRIHVSEGLDVDLRIESDSAQVVTVVYDDNLLDRIGTEVIDGELRIEVVDSFRVTGGGRLVTVVVPSLDQIEAESGADLRGIGKTGLIRVVASGGASIDLVDLVARDVVVEASGGAVILVAAVDSVTGEASGGSNVEIYGNPATIDVAASGGADVAERG